MTPSPVAWFIARRYLTARRRQAFIALISAVSILGVAVGVMALIIALALMTGVQREMRDRIVGSTAHVYVFGLGGGFDDVDRDVARLAAEPGVEAAAPAIVGLALLSAPGGEAKGAFVKGIDPAAEPRVTEIASAVRAGALDALAARTESGRHGIVLGADLARDLGVEVGDAVTVMTAEGTTSPLGLVPRFRVLSVVATVRFGFHEVDSAYGFVSLEAGAQLFRRTGPDLIQLRLADLDAAPAIAARLRTRLGAGYLVQDWAEINAPLYAALWLEKVGISLAIGLIVMVAALNIVASLVLLVMDKSRDIAILRTMGASTAVIRRIFVYQGLAVGLLGTGGGAVLGLAACAVLDRYRLIRMPAEVYQISYLPFRVEWPDVLVVVVSAVAVCLLATIYPSRQAARLDPAEALRYE